MKNTPTKMNWSAPLRRSSEEVKNEFLSIIEWAGIVFVTTIGAEVGFHCTLSERPWKWALATGAGSFLLAWFLIKKLLPLFYK